MFERIKLFSTAGTILFCIIFLSFALFGQIIHLINGFISVEYIISLLTVLSAYGYSSCIPIATKNIFLEFIKKNPRHEKLKPTYFSVAICSFVMTTMTTILILIFLLLVMITQHYYLLDITAILSTATFVVASILNLLVSPIPYLIIGTSTSFIIESCQTITRKNIFLYNRIFITL